MVQYNVNDLFYITSMRHSRWTVACKQLPSGSCAWMREDHAAHRDGAMGSLSTRASPATYPRAASSKVAPPKSSRSGRMRCSRMRPPGQDRWLPAWDAYTGTRSAVSDRQSDRDLSALLRLAFVGRHAVDN